MNEGDLGWMWSTFSPLVYIAAGWLGAVVYFTWLTAKSVPRNLNKYRAAILTLLHRRLTLEAEIADVDLELTQHWQQAPQPLATLIVTTVQGARLLPGRMRTLAARFGYKIPDVDEPVVLARAADPPPEQGALALVEEPEPESAWNGS